MPDQSTTAHINLNIGTRLRIDSSMGKLIYFYIYKEGHHGKNVAF